MSVGRLPARFSWSFLSVCLLTANVADAAYSFKGIEPSVRFEIISRLVLAMAIWYWFRRYSQTHRIKWPMDLGLFLTAVPYIVIPYYALRVERRRGLLTVAVLLGLYLVTYIIGQVVHLSLGDSNGG